MKKLLLAFVAISVLLCVVLTGCGAKKSNPNLASFNGTVSDSASDAGEAMVTAANEAVDVAETNVDKVNTVAEYFAQPDTKKAYDEAAQKMKEDYADATYSAESDDTALFVYTFKDHYYSEFEDAAADDIEALEPIIIEAAQNTLLELKTYTTIENPKVIFRYLQPDGTLAFEKSFDGDTVFSFDI